MENVILVNKNDAEIGVMEKMEAHRKGVLHRAFSVFLFNDEKELLIQQRAHSKYHSGGLWTNTCCSHPREKETTEDAAHRRLMEEMGIDTDLTSQFSFIYRAELDNELIEHELDHVFFGHYNGEPEVNPDEVADWKFMSLLQLQKEIAESPENFTVWFRIVFDEVCERLYADDTA